MLVQRDGGRVGCHHSGATISATATRHHHLLLDLLLLIRLVVDAGHLVGQVLSAARVQDLGYHIFDNNWSAVQLFIVHLVFLSSVPIVGSWLPLVFGLLAGTTWLLVQVLDRGQ